VLALTDGGVYDNMADEFQLDAVTADAARSRVTDLLERHLLHADIEL
jgi:hypothetical protein